MFKTVFGTILAIFFLALALLMFLGPPVAFIVETIDLFRMQAVTIGTVESVRIDRRRSTSRAVIHYSFDVARQHYESERYLPGFAGNQGGWTKGGAHAEQFPVGKKVPVYYDPDLPSRCALEYGWFKWPIGFGLGVWCMILRPFLLDNANRMQRGGNMLWHATNATLVYTFGLIIGGPNAVRCNELGWHGLAWCASLVIVIITGKLKAKSPEPEATVEPTPNIAS